VICVLPRPVAHFRPSALRLGVAALALTLVGCSSGSDTDDVAAAAALVEQGTTQVQNGEPEEAEETFARALRMDSDQALAHYNLGLIDQRANRKGDARKHYEKALAIAPDHGPTLYNSAILTEDDDLDAAIEAYRKAIEAQPEFAPAYMRLGFALAHLGRSAEAEPMLEKGLELDPAMADVQAPNYE
jgi:tetratricopeptide (TPR) repeat protein